MISQKHDTLLDSCNAFNAAVDYIFSYFSTKLGHGDFEFDTFMWPRKYDAGEMFVTEIGTKYAGKES